MSSTPALLLLQHRVPGSFVLCPATMTTTSMVVLGDTGQEFSVQSRSISNRILALAFVDTDADHSTLLYGEANWVFALPLRPYLSLDTVEPTATRVVSACSASLAGAQHSGGRRGIRAFCRSAVHGIKLPGRREPGAIIVCALGDHSIRLLSIEDGGNLAPSCTDSVTPVILSYKSKEQILDQLIVAVAFLNDKRVAVVLAHGTLVVFSSDLDLVGFRVDCQDASILYSARIVGSFFRISEDDDFLVVGGTAFGYLSFWSPSCQTDGSCQSLHKLHGHSGAVFSVDFCASRNLLCSTSDDRSCRVYCISFTERSQDMLPTVASWKTASFAHVYSLFGHEARVWRAEILSKHIVTVGEDARTNVWTNEGKLAKSWEVHNGVNIWSLCVKEDTDEIAVFTGGADGGIFSQKYFLETSKRVTHDEMTTLNFSAEKRVRHVAVWDEENFLVVAEGGQLYRVHGSQSDWIMLWACPELHQCVCVAVNYEVHLAAVLTCQGKIALVSVGQREQPVWLLNLEESCMKALWAVDSGDAPDILVVSGPSGKVRFFTHGSGLKCDGGLSLPQKSCWITAVAREDCVILCGDRSGSLHVISADQQDQGNEVYSCDNVHGQSEITHICFFGDLLMSSGRNGQIVLWSYDFHDCTDVKLQQLKVFQISKSVIEWVSGFWMSYCSPVSSFAMQVIAFGFRSRKYLAVDVATEDVLSEVDCGGGNRSFSAAYFEKGGFHRFAFVRTRGIGWADTRLSSRQDDWEALKPSMKASQIWGIVRTKDCVDSNGQRYLVYVIGCEDTTASILAVPWKTAKAVPQVPDIVSVCKRHLSSVRAVCQSGLYEDVFYTGGGRIQLVCWKRVGGALSGHVIPVCEWTPFPVVRKKWSDKSLLDPDTRIMSLHACAVGSREVLAAGTSDGVVRLFLVDPSSAACVSLCSALDALPCCVLKVRLIMLRHLTLIVTGTNGFIYMYVFRAVEKECDLKCPGRLDSSATMRRISCHQSGIAALDLCFCEGRKELLLATGGDDGAVHLTLLRSVDSLDDCDLFQFGEVDAHSAQVSGIQFVGDRFLVTASKDQSVRLWTCDLEGAKLTRVKSIYSTVADISFMDCSLLYREENTRSTTSPASTFPEIVVALVGAGFEQLHVTVSE